MAARSGSRIEETLSLVPVLAVRDTVHYPGLINTLHVVREPSLRALKKSFDGRRLVLVLSQRDMSLSDPGAGDLYAVGTLSETLQSIPLPDASLRVALRGLRRARATRVISKNGSFWAEIEELEELGALDIETDALMRACVDSFSRIVQMNKEIPPESLEGVVHAETAGVLADTILHHLPIRADEKQRLLEELDQKARLEGTLHLLKREHQILELNSHIVERVEREIGESQREFYLREQLRVIQNELQVREDRVGEYDEYRGRIEAAQMPCEAEEKAMAELRRLDRTPAASPEGMVLRNYLDTLVSLPWSLATEDRIDVRAAAGLLDERHFGLEKIKDRILDHLAVRQLKGSLRGPILCFVGPPGVGKTSLGRSIAEAMGRRFVRISLGGVRDEAELRGHRRTYVGSMPGRILQGIRDCGSRNPVILLDEIDKLAHGPHGDPTSALLEALDPEQNSRFSDHYVETPFDLSGVMFIATANLIENVPAPLRDRMEIVPFSAYTEEERAAIAEQFLFPKSLDDHGLLPGQVTLPSACIELLVRDYTREAGVRNLHRQIAALCRKSARRIAEHTATHVDLNIDRLTEFLGHPRYRKASASLVGEVGVTWGLVVSEAGGDIIPIEVSLTEPFGTRPELRLTGNLGTVMKESALAALTFIQASHRALGSGTAFRSDVHVHVPEGAVPKDGPSAGLAIAMALASAFSDRATVPGVAMTGEITLRGRILAVGGIRDKVLAAASAGMTTVIVPQENVQDLEDVPSNVLEKLRIIPVANASEAFSIVLA